MWQILKSKDTHIREFVSKLLLDLTTAFRRSSLVGGPSLVVPELYFPVTEIQRCNS